MSNLNRTTNLNTTTVTPLAGGMQNLSLQDKIVHEGERVINHVPIIEKEIINERPVEVRREHHVQPIIHEREHRIQPIIKTQATTEQTIIEKVRRFQHVSALHEHLPDLSLSLSQDKNVMEAPIIERAALPVGLEAVERAGPEGILHKAKLEREVVLEHPVEVRREHHVQPIIHEREHRIQPIIKTQATTERPVIEQDKNVMLAPIVERAALPVGLEAVERAGPEGILHKAKLEKDVVIEHPVQIKHEHHVQPIIHEREHHIQPIVKTEVTAQQKHINTEKNVMLPPLVERAALPVGLEAVERAGAEGVIHKAKLEKEIIVEHPVQVKHERHIQPIIHEREHHIQPIIKTEVTAARPVIEQEREVLLPPIIEPTVLVSGPALSSLPANTVINTTGLAAERGLAHTHKHGADVHSHKHADIRDEKLAHKHKHGADVHDHKHAGSFADSKSHAATSGTGHASVGQKLKGALKEVQGTVTRNPAKKEEGKMLMRGVDPASASSTRI
jgi:hypothetical protein